MKILTNESGHMAKMAAAARSNMGKCLYIGFPGKF